MAVRKSARIFVGAGFVTRVEDDCSEWSVDGDGFDR